MNRAAESPTVLPRALGALIMTLSFAGGLSAQQFQDQSIARLPDANEYSSQVVVADIDGDGDLDIGFANGRGFSTASVAERVRLMINDGTGNFTDESIARGAPIGFGRDVEFGDIDGDGDLDMVVANDFLNQQRLLVNDGTGNFTDESVARLGSLVISSAHCSFGDVDDDGDLDLWFAKGGASRFGSGSPQLLINDGTGFFTNESAARVPPQLFAEPMDCIFGDLDGDFDLDVVAGNRTANQSRTYFNDGTGVFTIGTLPSNSSTYSFDLGDIDSDGDLDIVGENSGAGSSEAIFINDGSGVFANQSSTWIPSNPSIDDNDSKFLDYDNDGDLDLVIASLGSTERILRNNGTSFQLIAGVITAIGDSSLDVEVADFDDDGDLDIVTAQGESGAFRNRIYINSGAADTFAPTLRVAQLSDTLDAVGPYVVRAEISDQMTSDTGAFYDATTLHYAVDGGGEVIVPLTWIGHQMYRGEIPGQPVGSNVSYFVRAVDRAGNLGASGTTAFAVIIPPQMFRRGDCNQDGAMDISDAVSALNTLFGGGSPFGCDDACDNNDDGSVDISDPVHGLATLFTMGPQPPAPGPGPGCGADPTADPIDCAIEPVCP